MQRLLRLYVPIALLIAAAFALLHYQEYRIARNELLLREQMAVTQAGQALSRDFELVVNDLRLLAGSDVLLSATDQPAAQQTQAELLRRFVHAQNRYSQLLYVADGGSRVVGSARSEGSILPDLTPEFIQRVLRQPSERVLMQPVLPARADETASFRFGIAVGAEGERVGALVLDYPAEELYATLGTVRGSSGVPVLVTSNGVAVLPPRADRPPLQRFQARFPDAWQRIQLRPGGQFRSSSGLFSFGTTVPAQAEAPPVYFVSFVPDEQIEALARDEWRSALPFLLLALLLWTAAYWGLQRLTRARELSRSESRMLSAVVEQTSDLVYITNLDGTIRYVNPSFESVTGYSQSEAVGASTSILASGEHDRAFYARLWRTLERGESFEALFTNRKRDGSLYYQQTTLSPLHAPGGSIIGYVSTGKDVSAQLQAESRLKLLAYRHPLTGLPNRALLTERAETAIDHARGAERMIALLMLDIDRFKRINSSLGHEAGDKLLLQVAGRLQSCVGAGDTVAHLGGDQFALLLEDLASPERIHAAVEHVLHSFETPFRLTGGEIGLSTAVGVAVFPGDAEDAGHLIERAGTALQNAKHPGRARYQFYSREMSERAQRRLELEGQLRTAMSERQFVLHYQPIVGPSGAIHGLEALLRWQRDDEMVLPDEFVPVLEETGLIVPLTPWILDEACQAAAALGKDTETAIHVSVNVAAPSFYGGGLREAVAAALAVSKLPARRLTLEVTETLLLEDDPEVRETLAELRAMGVRIAIDDFGVGYSSLAYLARIPADSLKIDRAFIHAMSADSKDAALVSAILAMAQELEIETVAEGVETAHQLAFLRDHHCDRLQGFLFSIPLPARTIAAKLAHDQRWPRKAWMARASIRGRLPRD